MFPSRLAAASRRRALRAAALVAVFLLSIAPPAWSQPRTASVAVTVVDQTGAVIGGATVTITGTDDVTKAAGTATVTTSNEGIANLANLVPGRYTIEAQFTGFEPRVLADVALRPGNNKQVALLTVAGLKDSVTVARDRQEAAVDPRGPSFGTQLTRDQIEALSDDPAILRQQLEEMAGPGAVFKVDSFEGGALPAKAQIRSIRITRDQFAAENHAAGGTSIEIITQPGLGPIRYNAGARFRGGSMSGRSPFTSTKGPEQQRNFYFGLNGTLIPEKSSFSIFVFGTDSYETPNINIVDANGTRSEPLPLRTPRDNINVNAQLDYALTLDHTLRFGYSSNLSDAENLGVGDYDEEQRAYSTENYVHNIRAQHFGPLGRRAFTRSRLQVRWSDSESRSAFELPTVRVNDAFTRGGAQVGGGQRSFGFTFGSDLDYVRSIHSLRTGILVDGGSVRADDTSNYLGTYTFESLAAYEAGRPRSYTRRIGDPLIRYETVQAAVYLQDDIKIRRNLTVSAGGRYEAQSHVDDFGSLMPRVGFTWAPFRTGTTVLRSSWGIFYDWLQGSTYEQTLRVDGFRQRELDIRDPSYPQIPPVDEIGVTLPVSRYVLSDGLELPRTTRISARRRSAHPEGQTSDERGVCLPARRGSVPRQQPERAGAWRPSRSGLRQRDRGRGRWPLPPAPAADRPHHEPGGAAAGAFQRAAHQLEADDAVRELHVRGPRQPRRRAVQRPGQWWPARQRVGTVVHRCASPVQHLAEQSDRQEPAGCAEPQREHRQCLQHPHRPRRQRLTSCSTIARGTWDATPNVAPRSGASTRSSATCSCSAGTSRTCRPGSPSSAAGPAALPRCRP